MKSIRLIISGDVQGVGFRYFAVKVADEFKLTGWVRNNVNSTVEIIVSGEDENVQNFVNKVILGNSFSKVDGVDIKSLEYRSFDLFKIIR